MTLESAVAATAIVVVLVVGAAAIALLLPPLDRRALRAGPLRRAARWYRSLWIRGWLIWFGWPHLVDLFLGAGRRHADATPSEIVWTEGSATLRRYHSARRHREPVLVVHALVTKPWILDLTPDRSFVGALVDAELDVFLLDWGDPGGADGARGLGDYGETLRRAERAVLDASDGDRVHEVGYCLAGTLLLLELASHPRPEVATAAVIAPLVDFAVPGGFEPLLAHPALRPALVLDHGSCVPAAAVREAFHALRPRGLRTVAARLRHPPDDEGRDFYAAMARWAWTHRRLPGGVLFDLVDLYRDNSLIARLDAIDVPVWMAVAERDHIVPSGSSHALTATSSIDVEVLQVASGHVSMLVGSAARTAFWPAITAWLVRSQARSD